MKVLSAGPAPRAERAASEVLHDEPNARVVAFHLLPGQEIPAHQNESSVIIQVVEGSGIFRGGAVTAALKAGQSAVFAPGEVHGMVAGAEPLRFVAIITPRPGG